MPIFKSLVPLEAVRYVTNHVFLPPALPGGNDYDADNDTALVKSVHSSLKSFKKQVPKSKEKAVDLACSMVDKLCRSRDEFGFLSETNTTEVLGALLPGETVPLHIKAQNAAVLVRHDTSNIVFEVFELLPSNEAVVSTRGRLLRHFPQAAVSVTLEKFREDGFVFALSAMLSKLSRQAVVEAEPERAGSGNLLSEQHDTTDPRLVTELLISFLQANGSSAEAKGVWKRTQDEVIGSDKNKSPWMRSALWLLLRVSLQITYKRSATDLYKRFQIFYMSRIIEAGRSHKFNSDTLYAMNAKLVQRSQKLGLTKDESWMKSACRQFSSTTRYLEKQWEIIREVNDKCLNLSPLSNLRLEQDLLFNLPDLDAYIGSIVQRNQMTDSNTFQPSSEILTVSEGALPKIGNISSEGPQTAYSLLAFETWVDDCLDSWLKSAQRKAFTCDDLNKAIRAYHRIATRVYDGLPEAISIMLLTILELWIACDKSVKIAHPDLADYDPQTPVDVWSSLLLKHKKDMARLSRAEDYLQRRRHIANLERHPSIFLSFGEEKSFAVRFYNKAASLQSLKQKVERKAQVERNAKIEEWARKKSEYRGLMAKCAARSCDYEEYEDEDGLEIRRHNPRCKRCVIKNEANAITIGVHEWPLPAEPLQAKATVFELQPPGAFRAWRDSTIYLISNVLIFSPSTKVTSRSKYTLANYSGLRSFFKGRSSQQVILLSDSNPHSSTNTLDKSMADISQEDVCVRNGLRWRYYDAEAEIFLNSFKETDEVTKLCTFKLPECADSLQKFLHRPSNRPSGLDPNLVIAFQHECPRHFALDEFKALCSLPLGYHVQWLNVLIQLSIPTIDWKKLETVLTVFQVTQQTGSKSGETIRPSHAILEDERFCSAILDGLEKSLSRVKGNWESCRAVGAFCHISARVLSLGPRGIRQRSLQYLRRCREVCQEWLRQLSGKATLTPDDTQRAKFNDKVFEIALICAESFSVDQELLRTMLKSPDDAMIFLGSSMSIQETSFGSLDDKHSKGSMVHRWRRLVYRAAPLLSEQIVQKSSACLDTAVRLFWSAYTPATKWKCNNVAEYWLECTSLGEGQSQSQHVAFNLLTAELLVEGRPLSHLPPSVEQHPTYNVFFGRSRLDVLPSSRHGLQFSAKKKFASYEIHLGLENLGDDGHLGDLLLRALRDGHIYDLAPSRLFLDKLPTLFAKEYVHWYDHTDGSVQFCPLSNPWAHDKSNWHLVKRGGGWVMRKGDDLCLVNPSSEPAGFMRDIFSPLEVLLGLQITFNQSNRALSIEIPRLKLDFTLDSGTYYIRSHQFVGMRVDDSQAVGTLFGLENKLVLCKISDPNSRILLIPEGPISWESWTYTSSRVLHMRVTIDGSMPSKVQTYTVDSRLGQLSGNGSLQSKLLLAYLHALTSHCLPDPLTDHTGTEQALGILRSEAVRSFSYLSQENIDVLVSIARLSPGRSYHPRHKKSMQVVTWLPSLGALSHHDEFVHLVNSLFQQARELKFFYPDHYIEPPEIDHADEHLRLRDAMRTSTFRTSGFGAEDHMPEFDTAYLSRDRGQNSTRSARAFEAVAALADGSPVLAKPFDSLFEDEEDDIQHHIYDLLATPEGLTGPTSTLTESDLQYDSRWLDPPESYLPHLWCKFHRTLKESFATFNKYFLMTWLASIAFAERSDGVATQTLLSITLVPAIRNIGMPTVGHLFLRNGKFATIAVIESAIKRYQTDFKYSQEAHLPRLATETARAARKRRNNLFQENQSRCVEKYGKSILKQWPSRELVAPRGESFDSYIQENQALRAVRDLFTDWHNNKDFAKYLRLIDNELSKLAVRAIVIPNSCLEREDYIKISTARFVSTKALLSEFNVDSSHNFTPDPAIKDLCTPEHSMSSLRLAGLLHKLTSKTSSRQEAEYLEDLEESTSCLAHRIQGYTLTKHGPELDELLRSHQVAVKAHHDAIYDAMLFAVGRVNQRGRNKTFQMIAESHQWPRFSPRLFLQQLNRENWPGLSSTWRECLASYGLALTEHQRAERLVQLVNNEVDLIKELQNEGHKSWDPLQSPESLLLEVESGLMIRDVQDQISRRMRCPPGDSNAVMQLNMGEGKSSVIVPIIALSLADGSRLVRVVCAKPQSKQMFEMLVSKLGGLLGRRVYHMPFSRALKIGEEEAGIIAKVYAQCMSEGGILLVQPEHILSFQLMGLECHISEHDSLGTMLLQTQHFFNTNTRDIVDESDENFSVKFELVYTIGQQRPIEHGPHRWLAIQEVLELVPRYSMVLKQTLPLSVEIHEHETRFPRTRLLHKNAEEKLVQLLATQICQNGLAGLPISRQPQGIRDAIFQYLTKLEPSEADIQAVEQSSLWNASTSTSLLLIRGLLAGRILGFAFAEKRWRVNYGLDATRKPATRLAVPYLAKDCPTARSEFSHPDVVIVLTCLCYYYSGLDDEQIFVTFKHLLKADQADVEYQVWVCSAPGLPDEFQQLEGINIRDRDQCVAHVFPHLKYSKGAIDYFLARIVFATEMREFPHKLSASGWDLGRIKSHPTTGFSGTNDSRHTLPLTVTQRDLPSQKHTNALVMEHLLGTENSVALMPSPECGVVSVGKKLLEMVTKMDPETQVILDIGAQIIELSNIEVAQTWLGLMGGHERIQAVIFCDDKDQVSVVNRQGQVELLQTSPFAKDLNTCLVFLDEAHTRGIDLRLPSHYRAAVTLGAKLTKDRLVQACMRMRKLGSGQSVVFCVPEEIRTKITTMKDSIGEQEITIADILAWTMSETSLDLRRTMPMWATQGRNFLRQSALWEDAQTSNGIAMRRELAERFLEDEARTIDSRYRPRSSADDTNPAEVPDCQMLGQISQRCQQFETSHMPSMNLQEEQERELAPEIEEERQVERPAPAEPAKHSIHPNVRKFVSDGHLSGAVPGFLWAFETLASTSAAKYLDLGQFPHGLRVTDDFARTIKQPQSHQIYDSFQRDVQWILTSVGQNNVVVNMVVISPYEAENLFVLIKGSKAVVLHTYAPRQNRGFAPLDHLHLHTIPSGDIKRLIPRRMIIELNLFAGQLYLESFKEYTEVCEYLGLA
ncbi:hypothetical protein G7046_g3736 [Stylonectria norvegica]|nr:hypothetical protein G7046_g3736 [Stylonectria norvegica]